MKCRYCKNEIADGSIFCNWCGKKQIKDRKKKDEIRVPAPRQLPSGKWFIQLRAEGQSITENTADLCIAKAKAIRAGWIKHKANLPQITLREAIDKYIANRDAVLSPSTVRGYSQIRDNRFRDVMDGELHENMDWQKICNAEAKKCSAKTLHNAWGFVQSVLNENGYATPKVRLPQIVKKERSWLTPEQITVFVREVKDRDIAIPALLALSSLRLSEILALTPANVNIEKKTIRVVGAVVQNKENKLQHKDENKTVASARTVPIFIPELLDAFEHSDGQYVTMHPNNIRKAINRICVQHGLPSVGFHGLRHSFASLAYHLNIPEREAMLIGGWDDRDTMDKIYIHLSDNQVQTATEQLEGYFTRLE